MAAVVEVDGEPVDAAQVALLGTLTYGHFTTMRLEGGRVRGLQLHLDRLVRDCAQVFAAPLDPDHVRELLRRVGERADAPVMLRATVFDPRFAPGRPDAAGVRPSVLVTARAAAPPEHRAGAARPDGLRLRTVEHVRDLPAVKHIGMFGPMHQRRLARVAGFDDALFVTGPGPGGRVCEGPTWNLALLTDGGLVWPDGDCLPGVTRALVAQVAGDLGVRSSFRPVQRAELSSARAAFVTSSGAGVRRVASIDGIDVGAAGGADADLLDRLLAHYAQLPGEEF